MFSFFKKSKSKEVDLSALRTDMHSHLLPGIDDGSPDVSTSDMLIQGLTNLGYERFVTTPHIMADVYPNTRSTVDSAYQKLKRETSLSTVNFPVTPAAEYLLDDGFDHLIKRPDPLFCISGQLGLVEFSFIAPPVDYKEKIFQLELRGYQPVLAHPERYVYWAGNKKVMDQLKAEGCMFAVNLLSLAGHYGKPCLEVSQYLLKKNYIDFLGTDLHHQRHLELLQQSPQLMPIIQQLLDSGNLKNPQL